MYSWRGPYSRTWDHLWLMYCCVHLKELMQGFLHFLWGNFCPESNSSSPAAFSLKQKPASSGPHRVENKLKVPKCEIFDPFFFTPINPIWVGDLRTGEKKFLFRRPRQIFCFFYAGWACAKNLPTQAEPALKNCLRRLSLR